MPREFPRGAIRTKAQIERLLRQAKKKPIPAFHYDSSDGTYLYRTITEDSYFDDQGLHYFNRDGKENRSGHDFWFSKSDGWFLFTNYWHLYAYSLKIGLPLREYDLA